MARSSSTRSRAKSTTAEAPEADATVETPATPAEAPTEVEETTTVTDTLTEAPAETTDEVTADEAPTGTETATETSAETTPAEDPEAALADFKAAFDTAIAEKDGATGTLPEAQIAAVSTQYHKLAGAKLKNAAKKFLNEKLKDAVNNQDIVSGFAVMTLSEKVTAPAPKSEREKTERAPADPSAAFVSRLATLHLAYGLVRADVPEGVDADEAYAKVDAKVAELDEQADAYFAWTKADADSRGDEPEVDAIVKKAVKAAQGKAATVAKASTPRVSDGVRRDVAKHITQVFAEVESGVFLTIAEIANKDTEEYPAGVVCSPGAVTNRLFPRDGKAMTVEGVTPGANDKGTRGATKN